MLHTIVNCNTRDVLELYIIVTNSAQFKTSLPLTINCYTYKSVADTMNESQWVEQTVM